MVDKKLNEKIEELKNVYINSIMTYLITGEFSLPQGTTYMKAHTQDDSFIRLGLYGKSEIGISRPLQRRFMSFLLLHQRTIAGKLMATTVLRTVAVPKILGKTGKDIITEFSEHWNKYTMLSYWMVKAFLFLVFDV